jgi:hypothetical protein
VQISIALVWKEGESVEKEGGIESAWLTWKIESLNLTLIVNVVDLNGFGLEGEEIGLVVSYGHRGVGPREVPARWHTIKSHENSSLW